MSLDSDHFSASGLTVCLVDSEALFRAAFAKLLPSLGSFTVTGQAGSAEEALALLEKVRPDILITELALPGRSGVELLHEIKRRQLSTRTIVVTRLSSEHIVRQALLAGAMGCCLKTATEDELKGCIRCILSGSTFVPRHLESRLARDGETKEPPADPLSPLSPREREIFFLLADGSQNSTIAKKLFISPRTVETHRARVVRKLGLSSNADLIRFAIKHGLSVVVSMPLLFSELHRLFFSHAI